MFNSILVSKLYLEHSHCFYYFLIQEENQMSNFKMKCCCRYVFVNLNILIDQFAPMLKVNTN